MTGRKRRDPSSSVWLRSAPSRPGSERTAPSGLGRAQIVAAAVRLLDTDGLGALSMRRLAAELDTSPMSLYWYVSTKDDLLEYALDQVLAEVEIPGDDRDWRQAIRDCAVSLRRTSVEHPWMTRLNGEYLNLGPNASALAVGTQRLVARSGLAAAQVPGGVALVLNFVWGSASQEAQWLERSRREGFDEDELYATVLASARAVGGRLSEAMDLAGPHSGRLHETRDRYFDFALEAILAGLQAMAARG